MIESSIPLSCATTGLHLYGRSRSARAPAAFDSTMHFDAGPAVPPRTVYLLDQDPLLRFKLADALRGVAIDVREFASVPEFFAGPPLEGTSCLVAEMRPHGGSGLLLQQTLKSTALAHMPVIFMSGPCDVSTTVRAMKAGAWDFLEKPFRDQEMIDAIVGALEHDEQRRNAERSRAVVAGRWQSLTRREREVLTAVAKGRLSKQIAADLGIAEITTKIHRSNGMRKMVCRTVAELMTQLHAFDLLQGDARPGASRRPTSLTA
jgi:FixJ family two-component response regulator